MQLSYTRLGTGPLLVLLHGLFGDKSNLSHLAQTFAPYYQTLCIDLPNHGESPWCTFMDYPSITDAIYKLIQQLGYREYTLLGHSLGGKIAMAMLQQNPTAITQLIVLDIAPSAYPTNLHDREFQALEAVMMQQATTSSEARRILHHYLEDRAVENFLLKSFKQQGWRFNVTALKNNYPHLAGWQPQPAFNGKVHFLMGQHSTYLTTTHYPALFQQFPQAKLYRILDAGHWLHTEKPQSVISLLNKILL